MMGRGVLPEEVLHRIDHLLPDPGLRFDQILSLSPDGISVVFHPESHIPVASVCLLAAIRTISQARYAVFECHAHGVYYREYTESTKDMEAIWFEQFYVEDAAHRLYGAAEDVAEALVLMLEIEDSRLREFKEGNVSKQAVVGRFLLKDRPDLTITRSIKALINAKSWCTMMSYRGRLVHEQPPLVSGLGIVHRRQRRWRKSPNGGAYLPFGGGDTPEFNTSTLIVPRSTPKTGQSSTAENRPVR